MKINYSFIIIFFAFTISSFTQEVNFTDSNLPIIVIDTHGEIIPHDGPKIVVDMGIIHNGEGVRNSINDPFNEYDNKIAIRLRGQSSGVYPKHSWGIETQDENGNNLNVSLLGLPSENDWVLHAPYADKTLMRNALTYKLSNDIGLWAPRTRFCELVLNGDYHGVYLLVEKVKQDPNRVNITEPDGNDITGGYLLEITDWGKIDPDEIYFVTPSSNKPIVIKYPKPDNLTDNQLQYITDYFNLFDEAAYANNFTDPQLGFPNYLDVESTIKSIVINELVKNIDAFHASSFMHKPKQRKLIMGPLWDFNVSFGNYFNLQYYTTDGWISNRSKHKWVNNFVTDEHFNSLVYHRWRQLINSKLNPQVIKQTIDEWVILLAEAQERNFIRWPVLGVNINPNHYVGVSYQDEINYLKNWVTSRLNWIKDEVNIDTGTDLTITEIYRGNNYGPYICDWIEIYNPHYYPVDLLGYKLFTNNHENQYTISNIEIDAKSYGIIGNADPNFTGACRLNILQNIDVLTGTEILSLINYFGEVVDIVEMNFDSHPYFAIDPYMPSGVISPYIDNAIGSNWKLSPNIGGSPGTRNYEPAVKLFINEILAINTNTNFDEFWEFDDWVEVYNYGELPIDLAGLYFTDDKADIFKYKLSENQSGSTVVFPSEYKVLWADENLQQGPFHIDFKLNGDGEYFAIYQENGNEIVVVDSLTFSRQTEGVSFGRKPGLPGIWTYFYEPTPGSANHGVVNVESEISSTISEYEVKQNYPNPFNNETIFSYSLPNKSYVTLEIYDVLGKRITSLVHKDQSPGTHKATWNGENSTGNSVSSGIYFSVFKAGNNKGDSEKYFHTSKIVFMK